MIAYYSYSLEIFAANPISNLGSATEWMTAAVAKRVAREARTGKDTGRKELWDFLNDKLEPNVTDPVKWWGVCLAIGSYFLPTADFL